LVVAEIVIGQNENEKNISIFERQLHIQIHAIVNKISTDYFLTTNCIVNESSFLERRF